MAHVRHSAPHYIRCLKSNDRNVPGVFDRVRVEEQLCYAGVLEAVKVTRAGYSSRVPLAEAEGFNVRTKQLADQQVMACGFTPESVRARLGQSFAACFKAKP